MRSLNAKTVLFQAIQLSISTRLDRTLPGATTPGQEGPGSNGNEEILHIPQNSGITGTSPSDYLVSYPGNSLGESYSSSADGQSLEFNINLCSIFLKTFLGPTTNYISKCSNTINW